MAAIASTILAPTSRLRYIELAGSPSAQENALAQRFQSFSSHAKHFELQSAAQRCARDVSARAWWSFSRKKADEQASAAADIAKPVTKSSKPQQLNGASTSSAPAAAPQDEEEEVEISWIQEKSEELVQLTGNAVKAIPGPRIGKSPVPWLLAVPVTYFSVTFVIAIYRTFQKYNSPQAKKRRLVGKNAFLVTSLDKYFPQRRQEFDEKTLKQLQRKCDFDSKEVLRKYIRYVMNERAFTPDTVADLIHLRKVSKVSDEDIADVLNEAARRIVNDKGTVLMDLRGLTERGIKRKAVVRALFSKLLYLSELEEFCSTTSKDHLQIKEIFGVTDEDANSLRIETLSQLSDIESLDNIVDSENNDATEQDVAPDSSKEA